MSVPMKKLLTEQIEIIFVGKNKFQVSKEKAQAVLTLLSENQPLKRTDNFESIPADEVFKELDARYTRPGVALRGARTKEGLSQVDLAKKLGVSQTDLSKMEHGKRPIGKKMAIRLAKIFKIDYRVFL
jgi:ribosome-binding protein aMBF1 (putative translation factor)